MNGELTRLMGATTERNMGKAVFGFCCQKCWASRVSVADIKTSSFYIPITTPLPLALCIRSD
jgi:hypothetical protein